MLKKMIPEEGKKRLDGVESLPSAWLLLDKLYGDERLICQKLKSRLKNLKPKATMSHEVVIEIGIETEYLNKRFTEMGAATMLNFDDDFLIACYRHLPKDCQRDWHKFSKSGFEHKWTAFMSFMEEMSSIAWELDKTHVNALKDEIDKDHSVQDTNALKHNITIIST